ncbi:MAG: hypothetical protein QXD77_03535, partial [Candidatus Aenigmatarchaeota archaeon]
MKDTNLVITSAPLPASFAGTPQQLFAAMLARMKIQSPAGTSLIVTGDAEPPTDQGPWLREGKKWYVWDEDTKRYVPADVSDSV